MSDFAATFNLDPAGYAAGRPGYPDVVFDVLEARCGLEPGSEVIEVGPGTGQATTELLRRGARVHAIEPGAALAEHLLAAHAGEALTVTVSSFEEADLVEGSADLVVAATSFHWVDTAIGPAKARSLLRPGGWIALWWNLWYNPDGPDAFSRALDPIFAEFGNRERPAYVDQRQEELWLPLMRPAGFEDVTAERFPWEVEQRSDELVALFSTFSGMRIRPAAEQAQMLERIRAMVDEQFAGSVRRTYQTALYTGRKPLRPD
jgi:SAM-dependent methyltransferase